LQRRPWNPRIGNDRANPPAKHDTMVFNSQQLRYSNDVGFNFDS